MNNCIFCQESENILYSDDYWYAIYDKYPVSNGHVLIISKNHKKDYFDLDIMESITLNGFIHIIKEIIDKKFHPNGYNIGCNCGKCAGQTINHFHLHLIPRYDNDVNDPTGGVRGVIPNKQKY